MPWAIHNCIRSNLLSGTSTASIVISAEIRLRSNVTVVQHLITLFGRIRSLVAHASLPDERTIDAFVTVLGNLLSNDTAQADPQSFGLPADAADLHAQLSGPPLDMAMRDIRTAPAALYALNLYPSLAIRHAGGRLFQEAHFDLVRAPPPDLFGYVDAATAKRTKGGGIHFTPPALARSIVDHTLKQIEGLSRRQSLTISDPACGSGAFLHEALRGLRRIAFNGALTIIGKDVSATAIAMANFTLKVALRDWQPDGGAILNLNVEDSLDAPSFPTADMIVMNPPFISVISQTAEQKAQLREVVGGEAASRGDYSMAFVTRAFEALADGGAMGTLFPANLLTHKASASWRERLATDGDVRLLASIGDFGLFSQALVHIACAVICKSGVPGREFTALVTDNDPDATGDALRELRKAAGTPPSIATMEGQWKLFAADAKLLRGRPWRILTPQQRRMVDSLDAAQTPTVEALFDIAQGVQTGSLKVFLLSEAEFRHIPSKERRFFRKALMTDSIRDGEIVRTYHLFFPHSKDGPLFESEATLAKAVPTFYDSVLKPNESTLRNRASIVRSKRWDWWGLMHERKFSFNNSPRIISKFFGAEGSFVFDEDAEYLPSTGHVWIPKSSLVRNEEEDSEAPETMPADVMRAYTALLNSRIFTRLVSFRSVTIAGGQFDLSSRYVGGVFLPNLWEKAEDPFVGDDVRRLAQITANLARGERTYQSDVDRIVARLYGVPQLAER
jgi:adenine-specific DNA-methyltransferase